MNGYGVFNGGCTTDRSYDSRHYSGKKVGTAVLVVFLLIRTMMTMIVMTINVNVTVNMNYSIERKDFKSIA